MQSELRSNRPRENEGHEKFFFHFFVSDTPGESILIVKEPLGLIDEKSLSD